jgi:ABC-type sulfate transport system permease component
LEFIALAVAHIVGSPPATHLLRIVREGLVEFLREHPISLPTAAARLAALLDAIRNGHRPP